MNKSLRNPFIALSEMASQKNWCWRIPCSTCGAMHFREGFKKIGIDLHPDSDSWNNDANFSNPLYLSMSTQKKMCDYLSEVDIKELNKVSSFPDWLGHIGLILYFCQSHAFKPGRHLKNEFLKIIEKDSYEYNELQSLNIIEFHHLNQFENAIHHGICTDNCNHRFIF